MRTTLKFSNQTNTPLQQSVSLTFTTLWANSADDKLAIFFSYFPENRICLFMQIVAKTGFGISIVKSCLLGKNVNKYFKMLSAEKKKKKNNTKTAPH